MTSAVMATDRVTYFRSISSNYMYTLIRTFNRKH